MLKRYPGPARWPLPTAALALSLGAVGAALLSQYRYDLQPCPWCVLQRAIFVAIAAAALLALPLPRVRLLRWLAGGLMLVLAACGAAAALWQHFVAASSTSCQQTLADVIVRGIGLDEALPQVFAAYASCADAAARLLGIPYEFYSLGLYLVLALMALVLLRRR
jgi:disulfide bond formation protein DsbB